jgi:hypothetical protein
LILHADCFAENGAEENNKNKNPSERSEYYAVSFNSTLNYNALRFIEVLKSGSRPQKNYAAELQKHYDNDLTHDGKERPKKEDLFKKLKTYLRKKNS